MKNIAPNIKRKRLIFEGIYKKGFRLSKKNIVKFLEELTKKLNMTLVHGPLVNNWAQQFNPEKYAAFEGWVMWAESGAQFYSWEKTGRLVTVDVFTCKEFDEDLAVEFINKWFDCETYEYIIIPDDN